MLKSFLDIILKNKLTILGLSVILFFYGVYVIVSELKVDVFPGLTRPMVTILVESEGLAPEEVETLIALPLESAMNGAPGVERVRSGCAVGFCIVFVEFDWSTDIYNDRQIVQERLQLASEQLPEGVTPVLAPISSVTGEIMIMSMYSKDPKAENATKPMDIRTLADWEVRRRLLTVPGVSQVITMGGGRKQYQIMLDSKKLIERDVTIEDVHKAVGESNLNASGGFLQETGPKEYLIRILGRAKTKEDLEKIVVKEGEISPVTIKDIAQVVEGIQPARGNAGFFKKIDDKIIGAAQCVSIAVIKQPGADTIKITEMVEKELESIQKSLPDDVLIEPNVFQQRTFINSSINNVVEALRDGAILVVIVMILVLMSLRASLITLIAIPMSFVSTMIIFNLMDMTINVMTLGGLAIAVGELVDSSIVIMENVFRRLKENSLRELPENSIKVITGATLEVGSSVVLGTVLVVIVFAPLFFLSGIEGRIFTPLGIAYIVSLLMSLLVAFALVPILCYGLLSKINVKDAKNKENISVKILSFVFKPMIKLALRFPLLVITFIISLIALSVVLFSNLGSNFLPPFNEGTIQVSPILPPGTDLSLSAEIGTQIEKRLLEVEDVTIVNRRTGRAELDEHAEGVQTSELLVSMNPDSKRNRDDVINEIREIVKSEYPEVLLNISQPISHRIDVILSGIQAQIAIKIFGDDLSKLRTKAQQVKEICGKIDGVVDLSIEPQDLVPQIQVQLKLDKLKNYQLSVGEVCEMLETAIGGRKVGEILQGQRSFDLVLRLQQDQRQDITTIKNLWIPLPQGGRIQITDIAEVFMAAGPYRIFRDNVQRRIAVQMNVQDRSLGEVISDIKSGVDSGNIEEPGYFVQYGGQFEAQQSATLIIVSLSIGALLVIFFLLMGEFKSISLTIQVLLAIPGALIGSVLILVLTGQEFNIAALAGMIALGGIASRNGILLINHYLHLMKDEGEEFSKSMIIRAGLERMVPVLMTAITTGIALVPLILTPGESGKEIIYPVALVVFGGLITSTLFEFLMRPALFWMFGKKPSQKLVKNNEINFIQQL